jgi:hypothetical protein
MWKLERRRAAAQACRGLNTGCEVAAALARCPTAPRLAVFGELCVEDLLILGAVH